MIGRYRTLLGIILGTENYLNFENYKFSEYNDGIFFNNCEVGPDLEESIYYIYYNKLPDMIELRETLNIKNKIITYFYKLLVNKDKKWFYFPEYRQINTIDLFNYAYIEHIENKIITDISRKDNFWNMSIGELLDKITYYESHHLYDLRDLLIDKLILNSNIDWNKIIGNGICPYCNKNFNSKFKTNQLSDIVISHINNEYTISADMTCNNCNLFDNPENKLFLNTLDDQSNKSTIIA